MADITLTQADADMLLAMENADAIAEEVAQRYFSVRLADVHSVITYYLRHKPGVRAYLKRREEQADEVRAEVERRRPSWTTASPPAVGAPGDAASSSGREPRRRHRPRAASTQSGGIGSD